MIILDGEKLSEKILDGVKKEIDEKQLKLKLAVFLIGDNAVSGLYVNRKQSVCKRVGIDFKLFESFFDIEEEELKKEITATSDRSDISGVVIQLPLPGNFNASEILNIIPVDKDVDVLSEISFEKFKKGELNIFPPVVGAVKHLFEEYKIEMKDKKIVLIGKGRLVGGPLSAWLSNEGVKFDIVDTKTEDISSLTKQADIIISGAGVPNIIKEEMIKDGAVLVDAGSASEDGKITGDIDKSSYDKASFVAPVPGGIGPMTVACLLENLVKLNS